MYINMSTDGLVNEFVIDTLLTRSFNRHNTHKQNGLKDKKKKTIKKDIN